jgi:hypothetical protein
MSGVAPDMAPSLAASEPSGNAVNGQVGVPAGGQVKVPNPRADHFLVRVARAPGRWPWRHGCADVAACTEGKHRRPCPRRWPKAARKSGRPHVCVAADASRLCPPGCTAHAATCPERQGGGLVFREIKERRRKTVPMPPELIAILTAHQKVQVLERDAAANLWQDHDVVFSQENGRPIDPRADWQEWSDILAQAGIPHAGTHTMRHSAATIALDQGVAWPWFRKCSATQISGSPAATRTSRPCLPRTRPPGSGEPCSGKLLRKLLRGAMIIKTRAVFALVRWWVEPPVGIEPTTCSLRVNRSAD